MKTSTLLLQTIDYMKHEKNKYNVQKGDNPWLVLFNFFHEIIDNQINNIKCKKCEECVKCIICEQCDKHRKCHNKKCNNCDIHTKLKYNDCKNCEECKNYNERKECKECKECNDCKQCIPKKIEKDNIDYNNYYKQSVNNYFNDNPHNNFVEQLDIIDNMTFHNQEHIRECCSVINEQIVYDMMNTQLKKLHIFKLFCFVYWMWKYSKIDNDETFDINFNDTFVNKYNEDKKHIDKIIDFNNNSQCHVYKDLIVSKLNDEQLNEFEIFIRTKYNSYKKLMYVNEQIEMRNKKCKQTQCFIIKILMILFVWNIMWYFNVYSLCKKIIINNMVLIAELSPFIMALYLQLGGRSKIINLCSSVINYLVRYKN